MHGWRNLVGYSPCGHKDSDTTEQLTLLLLGKLLNFSATATDAKSLQSCPTLCNPIDGSPPGSPVPGILQARTLEWVAISFSILVPYQGSNLYPLQWKLGVLTTGPPRNSPPYSFDLHFSNKLAVLSIFSCACWPSVCLLWRNVCLGLLSILWLGCYFWYCVV